MAVVEVEGVGGGRILLCVLRMMLVAWDFTRIAEIDAHSGFRCLAERKL